MARHAAIVCQSCGAKVRAGRASCPRCRAVLAAVPEAPRFDANRGMKIAVSALVAAVIVTAISLWPRGGQVAAPRSAAGIPSSTPGAGVPSVPPREAPGTAIGGAKVPFLDDRLGGGVAYASGSYEEALTVYRAALRRNPEDAETLSNMGQVLVRLERTDEALPLFQRAIQLRPDRWAYHFNLARAHGLLANWSDAVGEYEAARRLFPNDYVTEFNLGLALHKQGNDAAAVEAYQRAIALEPNDASFHMALGISCERLQRAGAAAAAYSRYVELAPDAPDVEKVRARIAQLAPQAAPAAARPPV